MDKRSSPKGPLLYEATLYSHGSEPEIRIGLNAAGVRAIELLEERERDGYLDTDDSRELLMLLQGEII